jgi:hypothetical protein
MGNLVIKSNISRENYLHYQLINYCQGGLLDRLNYLYLENPGINLSKNNEEAFRTACCAGDIYVVRQLITWKPDIDISALNWEGLRMSIMYGNLDIIKFYFEREYTLKPLDFITIAWHYKILRLLYLLDERRKNLSWITVDIENTGKEECPICQCVSTNIVSTPCGHSFCQECIKTWLNYNQSCPNCRAKFYLENDTVKNVVS